MSLEECKRLAKGKWGKKKELQLEIRRSRGMVDGEDVWLCLSRNPFDWPRKDWVVLVSAYGEVSSRYFEQKDSVEKYFEELTREYDLKEEEK